MGDTYNYWFPIFLNKKHFEISFEKIKKNMIVMKFGNMIKENKNHFTKNAKFDPKIVISVLPSLMNKMTVAF